MTSQKGSGLPAVLKLKDPELWKTGPYVNGEFLSASQGKTFEVNDPGKSEVIGHLPDQDVDDTKHAIDLAAQAFNTWKQTSAKERHDILVKWYHLMITHADDLAQICTAEMGKPLADSKGEVSYAASFFEWCAEEGVRAYGDVVPSPVPGMRSLVIKQPVGVCGILTPWNFPFAMITRKAAAALAAGCTIVCKPDPHTPYSALAMAELSRRAGVPKGVFNVLTTKENQAAVGKELCESPTVRKISFTGSTGVGALLMKQASSTLKKCSFELGGNAPFIVFDDADLDSAVQGAVACKFRSSGQTCVCANRIFVQDSVHDAFVEKLIEAVKEFKLGYGFDKDVTHGPLIHENAIKKVEQHVQDAQDQGAKVVVGGSKKPDLGATYFEPTVITGMKPSMRINQEETFGPVAGVFKFKDETEVLRLANDTQYGLAGYFYSKDVARIFRVAEELEVGMIGVNTGLISQASIPFGGIKESGFGREGSKYALDEYTVTKLVAIQT